MKPLTAIISLLCVAGTIGAWFFFTRPLPAPTASNQPAPELAETPTPPAKPQAKPTSPSTQRARTEAQSSVRPTPEVNPASSKATAPAVPLVFSQALDTLTTPTSTYDQKQAAWTQLRNAGHLDQAISALEQRAVANPNAPQYPATLGQAYLQKAGTITDVREQGILGMKADQSFEAALSLDPSNWEARFWKATAMSYWPPQLNKGREVLEQFTTLIEQQEAGSRQPQFAQTYLLLGNEYQKQGYEEHARQVWQRGAAFYPENSELRQKAQP